MEPDRAHSFNERLNQWVASQGFWFQLKYSMSGKGLTGSGGYHFLRLVFRTLVFLLVLGVGAFFYLLRLPNTEGFKESVEEGIVTGLKGEDLKMDRFNREQGKLTIARLAGTGKEDAFFTDFDAKNINCRMGILDSVRKPWRTGGLMISDLHMNLRAGAMDAASAARLGDVLFQNDQDLEINSIDVENATLTWGYSEFTNGRIEGSVLKVRRRGEGWWFQFKGGTFSQNWLRGLEIREISLVCLPGEGIRLEKGLLGKGAGSFTFQELSIKGGERPAVEGKADFKNLPMECMIPAVVAQMMEGAVSGKLELSGSTNSQEGIGMTGKVELGEGDGILLRDRIPLLRVFRLVDSFNNYRRVKFQEGSFNLKSGNGRLELGEIDLTAGDLMTMKGGMTVRPPTKEEREKAVEVPPRDSPFASEPLPTPAEPDREEFSLKRAAQESRKKAGKQGVGNPFERYETVAEQRAFESVMAGRFAEALRYEGGLQITIRPDAFDQAPELKQEHPVDETSGRIPLKVPISGTLDLVTFGQAEAIYSKGRR